jgi:hypothetical protein
MSGKGKICIRRIFGQESKGGKGGGNLAAMISIRYFVVMPFLKKKKKQ